MIKEGNNRVDEFIKNPKKALLILAVPMVIAFLVQSLYNVVDTIFVGRLGAEAIAAVTLCFPLFFILGAFASGIGIGITAIVGRRVGEKRKEAAENASCHGLIISFIVSLCFLVLGIIFIKPIFSIFGAEEMVFNYGVEYMKIIISFIPIFFISNALFAILSGEGDTKTPMIIKVVAVVLNIIFDPIFIYYLDYGVKGAAIATVLAETIGLVIFMYIFFIRKTGYIQVNFRLFKYKQKIMNQILKIGTPVMLTQLIMSLGITLLNIVWTDFGTSYIAAFGLAVRFDTFVVMPLLGISGALVALISIFKGAKKPELIRYISWYGIKISLIITLVAGFFFFIFAEYALRIFTNDPQLIKIGSTILRVLIFNYPMMAIGMNAGRIIQGLGSGVPGLVITFTRVILIAIPLAYIFVYVWGYGYVSVLIAILISSFISVIISLKWLNHYFKKINHEL